MKKNRRSPKRLLPALLLFLTLASAILCTAAVLHTVHVQAAQSSTSSEDTKTSKSGWVTAKDGSISYYSKGKKVTGLKTIGSSRYYFNKKGVLQTGWKTISGKTYYFRKKATSSKRKGAAMTGLKAIGRYKYYFNSKGVMQTGWQTIDGKQYYFKKKASSSKRKGTMLSGLQTIGGVTYYFGRGFTQAALEEAAEEMLSEMTLKEKIAQMFIVTPESLTGGSTVTKASSTLKKALASYPVGGIIFMGDNLVSKSQTKSLLEKTMSYSLSASGLPIFLAVDEEGGTVARIANNSAFGVTNVGNASTIGATKNTKKAYKAGVTIGTYLSDLGFNLDMAPVADVLTNSKNTVVKKRSYGSDPELVSSMVSSMVSGLEEEGVLACIKHFPGHGATSADSHNGTAYVNKTIKQLKKAELIPFADQIEEGISFIMVGHISLPKVTGDDTPATLSYEIVTELLREDMGYDGIVITDSMNMEAITDNYSIADASVQAVNAGVDMLLMDGSFKTAYKAVYNAVKSGEISEERIDESVLRILKVKMLLDG